MAESKIYDTMYATMKELLQKEEDEEIKAIQTKKKLILDSLERCSAEIIEDAKEAHLKIIKNIIAGKLEGQFQVNIYYQYKVPFFNLLKKDFPNSEIEYAEEVGEYVDDIYHYVKFKINAADFVLNRVAINKYKAYLEKKEEVTKQIENLKRKREEISLDDIQQNNPLLM